MAELKYLVAIGLGVALTFGLIYNFAFASDKTIFLVTQNNSNSTCTDTTFYDQSLVNNSNTWDLVNSLYSPSSDSALIGTISDGIWNGKNLTKITFYLGAFNSGGNQLKGLIHAGVWNSLGNQVADFGSINASSMIVSNAFSNSTLTVIPLTFTGSYILKTNDTIGFTYSENSSGQSLPNPWALGIVGFANYGVITSHTGIVDYYGVLNTNDPTFSNSGNNDFSNSLRAVYYENACDKDNFLTNGANTDNNYQIYKNTTSGVMYLRTITNGSGVTITNDSNTITISASSTNVTSLNNGVPVSTNQLQRFPIKYVNSDYNITTSDFVILCDSSAGTVNVYLPNAVGITGNIYYIKENSTNPSPDNCVVNAHAGTSQKIDGQSSYTLQPRTIMAVSDSGKGWEIINPVCSQDFTYINMCANGNPFVKEVAQTGDFIFVQDLGDHIKINNDGVWTVNNGTGINVNQTQYNTLISTNFKNGTGISITGTVAQTFTNTGVISNSCSLGITCSGTNPSTFTPSWQLLCDNTATGDVACNNLPAMQFLHISVFIFNATGGTNPIPALRFNNDSNTHYSFRVSINGAADVTGTSVTACEPVGGTTIGSGEGQFYTMDVLNKQTVRKFAYTQTAYGFTSSASTAPVKDEATCKWDNTTNQITSINVARPSGTSTFATSQLVIWGYN